MAVDDERPLQHKVEEEESWAFRTASYVFRRNCEECLDYLWKLENTPDKALPLAKDRDLQEKTSQEVIRLLTNCVGAAESLRNTVDGLHRRLHSDGSFSEFPEQREAKYGTNPVVQFVLRLRGYLVHVKPIAVVYKFAIDDPTDVSGLRVEVGFELDALQRDAKGWRGNRASVQAARRYLNDLAERPSLKRPSLFKHLLQFRVQVQDFYEWFAQREMELQGKRLGREVDLGEESSE